MTNEQDTGECIYCGRRAKLRRDHVPPKSIFPPPRPNNLITVPACNECNLGASSHDEYLRVVMALRGDVANGLAGSSIRSTVMRSLDRPNAAGLRQSIEDATVPSPILDSRGEPFSILKVNVERLAVVVNRVTAGLFFHFCGRRIPKDYQVGSQLDSEFGVRTLQNLQELSEVIDKSPLRVDHPGIYQAQFVVDAEDPNTTVWRHRFYDAVTITAATMPRDANGEAV